MFYFKSSAEDLMFYFNFPAGIFLEVIIMRRSYVNKSRSAKKFRRSVQRTKAANIAPNPQRGGWRL